MKQLLEQSLNQSLNQWKTNRAIWFVEIKASIWLTVW
jgi:hypothetical protein